jgi:hypothetical protein
MPSGWSDSSTERFSGWDIIPTQVPKLAKSISDTSWSLNGLNFLPRFIGLFVLLFLPI